MSLKPWLVDVPVQVNIWVRPECQRPQFEILRQARPSILFILSDGGRNDDEWRIINEHRKMFDEEIDWDCTVYRLYENENLGLYGTMQPLWDMVWSHVDRCVVLEDDDLPAVSFFRFCAELLERYKDDERISCICGTNSFDTREGCTSDYFFSEGGSIWGYATWKRVYDTYGDFEYGKDPYTMRLLQNLCKRDHTLWRQIKTFSSGTTYAGHIAGDEYYLEFAKFGHHQLHIVPTKNMISNIGCGASSEHADDLKAMTPGMRRVFNTKTYEVEFPLRHPQNVINDIEYAERFDRLICRNHPFLFGCRMSYRFLLMVRYGQLMKAVGKVKRLIGLEEER